MKPYTLTENQLQNAIQARYQQQSNVGHGVVGNGKAISRVRELGYFEELEMLAMQIDAEKRAKQMKFDFDSIVKLTKLERIFSKPENQQSLSYSEFLSVKHELQSRHGLKPTEQQVKKMLGESVKLSSKLERML